MREGVYRGMKDYIEVHEYDHAWAGILVRKKSIDRVEHSLEGDNGCKLFLNSGDMIHCIETYISIKEELTKTHLKTPKEHYEFVENENEE